MSRFEKLLANHEAKQATRRAATGEEHYSQKVAKLKRRSRKVSVDQKDIDRIVALPIVPPISDEEAEEVSRRWLLANAWDRGNRLLITQAEGIQTFEDYGAGFFKIGVGWGKTGLSLLCAEHAYRNGAHRILLFVPASVYGQLINKDIAFWRKLVSLSMPIHRLGNQSVKMRRRIVDAQRKGLYIMPASLLSRPDSLHMLRSIDPDLIIADEAHMFKNRRSGRSKKLFGWCQERIAEDRDVPALVAMSGTMTNKSVKDYHHLITWALESDSPLPISASLAEEWGGVIDSGGSMIGEYQRTGSLIRVVNWASSNFPDENFRENVTDFRRAFQLRLTTAPGVVNTGDKDIGTSLILTTSKCPEPGVQLQNLMWQVQEEDTTPCGDVIEHGMQKFKWMSELTAGFYNQLVWPSAERLASRTWTRQGKEIKFDLENASEALDLALEHHSRHQVYSKELREFLNGSPLGLDTPMEVARAISQHPEAMPDLLVTLYNNMKLVQIESENRFGMLVEREAKVQRVDDYKIQAAAEWVMDPFLAGEGAVVWYWHNGIGQWLRDQLELEGVNPVYCPAGQDGNERILDPKNANRILVAGIGAHHIGKNLQHFQNQLFVQWPRTASIAEQVLGRLHRTGQEADVLYAHRFDVTAFDAVNFAACLNDAVYNHQSTGDRQKMVYARYEPLPPIFSPEFLREQGADPKMLNAQQRNMMEDLFGENWTDAL